MRPVPAKVATAVCVVLCCIATAQSQQVRRRDPAPFERPKPLIALSSTSTDQTLKALRQLVESRGFVVTKIDRERGEFLAIKQDAPTSESSDRVLLWLERDPSKPMERAQVYLLFGRFEPFVGSNDGPVRVIMWNSELARMTALEDAIIALANGQ